jgi:hypothetical protein
MLAGNARQTGWCQMLDIELFVTDAIAKVERNALPELPFLQDIGREKLSVRVSSMIVWQTHNEAQMQMLSCM